MFISKKKHQDVLMVARERTQELSDENRKLRDLLSQKDEELKDARNLRGVLDKLAEKSALYLSSNCYGAERNFPDNVAIYVDDYFGGSVIKQEATKVIEISKDGAIKTGLTRQKPDHGYNYILRRE